jgi:hypothetical protein
MLHKSYQTGMLPNLSNAALLGILWVTRLFTPLESPAIHGGDDINKTSIPHHVRKLFSNGTHRKGGVKAPSFLTGFTKSDLCHMLGIPVFNIGMWPLESFSSIPVCWIIWFFLQH